MDKRDANRFVSNFFYMLVSISLYYDLFGHLFLNEARTKICCSGLLETQGTVVEGKEKVRSSFNSGNSEQELQNAILLIFYRPPTRDLQVFAIRLSEGDVETGDDGHWQLHSIKAVGEENQSTELL